MEDYWVYILRCADQSLYTGIAKDIERRLNEHNKGVNGAKYTRSRRPVSLAYLEVVSTRSDALKREIDIKKLSKSAKNTLVSVMLEESRMHAQTCGLSLDAVGDLS